MCPSFSFPKMEEVKILTVIKFKHDRTRITNVNYNLKFNLLWGC